MKIEKYKYWLELRKDLLRVSRQFIQEEITEHEAVENDKKIINEFIEIRTKNTRKIDPELIKLKNKLDNDPKISDVFEYLIMRNMIAHNKSREATVKIWVLIGNLPKKYI